MSRVVPIPPLFPRQSVGPRWWVVLAALVSVVCGILTAVVIRPATQRLEALLGSMLAPWFALLCVIAVILVRERGDAFNLARLVALVYLARWVVVVPVQASDGFFFLPHGGDIGQLLRATQWLAVLSLVAFYVGWSISAGRVVGHRLEAAPIDPSARRARTVALCLVVAGVIFFVAYLAVLGVLHQPFAATNFRGDVAGTVRRAEFLYFGAYLLIAGTVLYYAYGYDRLRTRLVAYGLIAANVLFFAVTESRWRATAAILTIVVFHHYRVRRIRAAGFAVLAAAYVVFATMFVPLRGADKPSLTERPTAFLREALPSVEDVRTFAYTDVGHVDSVMTAVEDVPARVPYSNGETFVLGAFGPVASKGFSLFDHTVVGAGETLTASANGVDPTRLEGALAPTLLGEAYLARGWFGVASIFVVFGMVGRVVYAGTVERGAGSRRGALIAALIVPNLVVMLEGNSSHIFHFLLVAAQAWLAVRSLTPGRKPLARTSVRWALAYTVLAAMVVYPATLLLGSLPVGKALVLAAGCAAVVGAGVVASRAVRTTPHARGTVQ